MFEVNIRFIGGLLAAYYLSGQEVSARNSNRSGKKKKKASLSEEKDFHPFFPSCWPLLAPPPLLLSAPISTSRQALGVVFKVRDAVSTPMSLFGLYAPFSSSSVRSVYLALQFSHRD